MYSKLFAPFSDLAKTLLPQAFDGACDGSHDVSHLARVWKNARHIRRYEGGNEKFLAAATILHDCVSVEKNSPNRPIASKLAAEKAEMLLKAAGWSAEELSIVTHAIEAHSFSANITPRNIEAMILQDADRLDAIGMIGIARCFYTSGRLGSGLYDPIDPEAKDRPLDDAQFAIDHFHTKLLKLSSGFQTPTGKRMAQDRHLRLQDFLRDFMLEVVNGG